jgi:hypothetical protein
MPGIFILAGLATTNTNPTNFCKVERLIFETTKITDDAKFRR